MSEHHGQRWPQQNKQFQQQLFPMINSALAAEPADYDDAVAALCKVDAKVIAPFYAQHYSTYAADVRRQWDKAMMKWAHSNKGKQVNRTTIRLVPALMAKLPVIDSVDEVLPELQWLAANDHDRAAEALKQLRDHVDEADLRQLLALDMTDWKSGQSAVEGYYQVLFQDSNNPQMQEAYAVFLARLAETGWSTAASSEIAAYLRSVPCVQPLRPLSGKPTLM